MKLRWIPLFSSLLICSLSPLSLNAQQQGEARLSMTTRQPTVTKKGAKPDFGPNVMIFDPSMSSAGDPEADRCGVCDAGAQRVWAAAERAAVSAGRLFGGRAGRFLHGGDGAGGVARCNADCGQHACGRES